MMSWGVSSVLGSSSSGGRVAPQCAGLVDEGWAGGFAEVAEGFTEDVVVQRPVGDGLGFDGDPGVGVARCLAGEHVVECASLSVARVSAGPRFQVLRRVAISEVWRYSSL